MKITTNLGMCMAGLIHRKKDNDPIVQVNGNYYIHKGDTWDKRRLSLTNKRRIQAFHTHKKNVVWVYQKCRLLRANSGCRQALIQMDSISPPVPTGLILQPTNHLPIFSKVKPLEAKRSNGCI